MRTFENRTIGAHKTFCDINDTTVAHVYIIYHNDIGYIEIATNHNSKKHWKTLKLGDYLINDAMENELLNEYYMTACNTVSHQMYID